LTALLYRQCKYYCNSEAEVALTSTARRERGEAATEEKDLNTETEGKAEKYYPLTRQSAGGEEIYGVVCLVKRGQGSVS